MSGISASGLKTQIRSYTEVDDGVLTDAVLENIILNAQQRIAMDVPIDADRFVQEGTLAANDNTINAPAGCLFVRGIEVFESNANTEGNGKWLEKKDQTYLSEFVDRKFGPSGEIQSPSDTTNSVTGFPKYYAMFGGATGLSDTTSGGMYLAPTPDANYKFRIYYNKVPVLLEGDNTNYISLNFPQGLLYCCLAEAYGFLKGPMEMLTLYENKYKQEIQKFAGMQIGRRRRDDYTDGTVRIPVQSPSP